MINSQGCKVKLHSIKRHGRYLLDRDVTLLNVIVIFSVSLSLIKIDTILSLDLLLFFLFFTLLPLMHFYHFVAIVVNNDHEVFFLI